MTYKMYKEEQKSFKRFQTIIWQNMFLALILIQKVANR